MQHEKPRALTTLKLASAALLSLLLLAPHAPADPRPQQVKPPIGKEGLLKSLKEKALTDGELISEISARGVNFQLTPPVENEIRRAARYLKNQGRNRLIAALRANYRAPKRPDIYRARVTLIDPQRRPVDDAKVWSSIGGEPKKVAGGWQFDIPAASVPADGKVTFFATKESAFLTGEQNLLLATDASPAITIELIKNGKGVVRGIIVDEAGNAVGEVRVSVVGYETESVVTQPNGGFVLPAHASVGQQVLLHAEKPGYKAVNQYHPAGEEPATIVLERR